MRQIFACYECNLNEDKNCSSCSLTKKQQRHCGTQKLLLSFIAIAIVKEQFMLYVFLKTFS